VRLWVLGPVAVQADDGQVLVPGRRQERGLLGILLIEAGRMVPAARLCDLLWDGQPPGSARQAVRSHVARLRALLRRAGADGHGVALLGRGDGYLVQTDPDLVDLHRFQGLVQRARGVEDAAQREELLREALHLWRGPVLEDAASDWLRERICAELEESRVDAVEGWAAAGLMLGRHHEVLPELARLADGYPARERLVELQMRALHQAGRTTDALAVYTRIRGYLAEQYGLDPGPALQRLHQAVLRNDSPAGALAADASQPARPAQLPATVADFVGRRGELDQLDALMSVDPERGAAAPVIVAITGTAGVGKTALAVHWANRVRDRFPDGQLYANLSGHGDQPPVRPYTALAGLLRALGVSAEGMPTDLEQAAGLYRSLLADRRALVLLDNAADPGQVRPLLPGASGCLAVVTSRDRLSGLVARDGARRVALDVLSTSDALDLLVRMLGARRVDGEPAAAGALAHVCARLPLAVRIAAACLTDRPDRMIAEQVTELTGEDALRALQIDGDPDTAVRVAFEHSLRRLDLPVAGLFALTGLVRGDDLTAPAAAALAGTTTASAGRLLDALCAAHLVEEYRPGRYRTHDLLHRYAAEAVRDRYPEARRAQAIGRLTDWYLHQAGAAARATYTWQRHMAQPPAGRPDAELASPRQAQTWLEVELPNLLAAAAQAADNGHQATAWLLADALRGHLGASRDADALRTIAAIGLSAAGKAGDRKAEASMHLALAEAARIGGEYAVQRDHGREALRLAQAADWRVGEATALADLGIAHLDSGETPAAEQRLSEAIAMMEGLGHTENLADAVNALGVACSWRGALSEAAEHLPRATALYEADGNLGGSGHSLSHLALVQHRLGHPQALTTAGGALAIQQRIDYRYGQALALSVTASIRHDLGDHELACLDAEGAMLVARQARGRVIEGQALTILGASRNRLGHSDGVDLIRRGLRILQNIRHLRAQAEALVRLAQALAHIGDHETAAAHASNALTLTRKGGYRLLTADARALLATLAASG
jgi:DNA-binding SARP family transcriptional activator/tetratricopeptide (TPR) repeat protein